VANHKLNVKALRKSRGKAQGAEARPQRLRAQKERLRARKALGLAACQGAKKKKASQEEVKEAARAKAAREKEQARDAVNGGPR